MMPLNLCQMTSQVPPRRWALLDDGEVPPFSCHFFSRSVYLWTWEPKGIPKIREAPYIPRTLPNSGAATFSLLYGVAASQAFPGSTFLCDARLPRKLWRQCHILPLFAAEMWRCCLKFAADGSDWFQLLHHSGCQT